VAEAEQALALRVRALALLALGLSAQCFAASPAYDAAQRVPFTFAPTRAVLVLIPGADAAQSLGDHRPAAVDAASPAEASLLRECAAGESQRTQTSRGFLWDVATTGWRVLLHPVAVAVHDELLKYSNVSEASASGDYYRADDLGSGGTAVLNSRISCLRFTRLTAAESGADEVALDFIASLRLDASRDAIRLRPLRLYVNQAAAKSADGHYSLAIAVRADAVWRDQIAGHSGQVFEQTVATENVDLKSGSVLKYYPTDAGSGVRVPIVPVSFGVDRTRDFGIAKFSVSVAELGTPPQTLTLLADMLPDPNQPLEKLLVAAALARARLQ